MRRCWWFLVSCIGSLLVVIGGLVLTAGVLLLAWSARRTAAEIASSPSEPTSDLNPSEVRPPPFPPNREIREGDRPRHAVTHADQATVLRAIDDLIANVLDGTRALGIVRDERGHGVIVRTPEGRC